MIVDFALAFLVGGIVGYWIGQQSLIKHHRRLYNLRTNFNLLYAEHTEKDKIFYEINKTAVKLFEVSAK